VVPEFSRKKRESPENEDVVSSFKSRALIKDFSNVALIASPVAY
jgi:hypothetical protein